MTTEDYDNPEVEERWCAQQRDVVVAYLQTEGVKHRRVGDWPAWHVAPYVSIWAIESYKRPEWIGWWVICGDLPTDYISASDIESPQHPRKALKAIAERWLLYVEETKNGNKPANYSIGKPESFDELAPLLVKRADLFIEWAQDDTLWEEKYTWIWHEGRFHNSACAFWYRISLGLLLSLFRLLLRYRQFIIKLPEREDSMIINAIHTDGNSAALRSHR